MAQARRGVEAIRAARAPCYRPAMTLTGLLGGSFNPAHRGHRRISLAALDALGLDEIWWLVSPGNPLKPSKGHGAARRRASPRPGGRRAAPASAPPRSSASSARSTPPTRSRRSSAAIPDRRFVWLMGADNLAQFHRWRDWRRIARTMPIAVVDSSGL